MKKTNKQTNKKSKFLEREQAVLIVARQKCPSYLNIKLHHMSSISSSIQLETNQESPHEAPVLFLQQPIAEMTRDSL